MAETVEKQSINERVDEGLDQEALHLLTMLNLDAKNLVGKNIVDMGAGMGSLAHYLNKRGANVCSLDMKPPTNYISDKIEAARKFEETDESSADLKDLHIEIEKRYHEDDTFFIGNMKKTTFPEETFDLVVACHTLPVMGKPEAQVVEDVVSEMLRITKPGGEIRIGPVGLFTNKSDKKDNQTVALGGLQLREMYPDAEVRFKGVAGEKGEVDVLIIKKRHLAKD